MAKRWTVLGPTAWLPHRRLRALGAWLLITSSAVAMLAVVAAWLSVSVATCLVILVLAPATTVVVYEVWGYRHQAALTA